MSWIGKLSPVIIFVIVLLAVVLFVASLVHLLLLHLSKRRGPANSHNYPLPASAASGGGFQRQLQQLFNLHDSGMDQSQIDALPVFLYRDIIITGLREPFDCAVCLCEFSGQDRLRLLPSCSHAFHIGCIDTWLLSNSTCPLCRGVILSSGYSFQDPFFYFEAASKEDVEGGGLPCAASSSSSGSAVISEKRVFSVRLGKFRSCTNNNNNNNNNNDNDQESEVGGESSNLDGRRCFSMGSCQYVVDDLELQVALCPSGRRGGQNGNFTGGGGGEVEGKKINSRVKGESFSVSKIWLWSKKGKLPSLP